MDADEKPYIPCFSAEIHSLALEADEEKERFNRLTAGYTREQWEALAERWYARLEVHYPMPEGYKRGPTEFNESGTPIFYGAPNYVRIEEVADGVEA